MFHLTSPGIFSVYQARSFLHFSKRNNIGNERFVQPFIVFSTHAFKLADHAQRQVTQVLFIGHQYIDHRTQFIDQSGFVAGIIDTDQGQFFFSKFRSRAEDILVVEGEMDALTATAAGVPDAVAIGGSEVTGERRRQIEDAFRRGVKRITLCLDLDTVKDSGGVPNLAARHEHIMKTVHTIKDVDPSFDNIFIANFPEPCDPDEYVNRFGSAAFLELVGQAVPYWRYACDYFESLGRD